MNDIAEQRPDFFEGEILSASDLEQLVVYMRDQSARHLLGAHTWGIVAGLQLLEQSSPGGVLDVYLLPGYAIDGYGRGIVVVNPLRLSVDSFNGQPTGPVQVWIRYDQGQTSAVQPGFQVCCNGGEAYSRVAESYAIEVGNPSLATQQSGISIAGETLDDARTALRQFNDAGPLLCDASVPYQDMPLADDTKSRWLIPLGQVNWVMGTPGNFTALDDAPPTHDKVVYSRRLRRYAGLVTENLYASDGLIRLRGRTHEVSGTVDPAAINKACKDGDLSGDDHFSDVQFCPGGATPKELVWVEGRMRVIDDLRVLAPARIELRDHDDTDYAVSSDNALTAPSQPVFLQRTDRTVVSDKNLYADLQLVIGTTPDTGTDHNKLLIQTAATPNQVAGCEQVTFQAMSTKVAVLDNGNVGIGTETPDQLLQIVNSAAQAFIHLQDQKGPSDFFVGAGSTGGILAAGVDNDIRLRTGNADPTDDSATQMRILSTGQVGIGTADPDVKYALTVQGDTQGSMVLRTKDGKHEAVLIADKDGTTLAANSSNDDLLLGCDGGDVKVWIKPSGNVGIGTDTPDHLIHVVGKQSARIECESTSGSNTKLLLGVESAGAFIGATSNDDLRLRADDKDVAWVTPDQRVGIRTGDPQHVLDVRGNIALGSNGEYFAPGSQTNWRFVAGSIAYDGSITTGQGFTVDHNADTGVYVVKYNSPRAHTPVVVVSCRDSNRNGGLLVAVVTSSDTNQFRVENAVITGVASGLDAGFNFTSLVEDNP